MKEWYLETPTPNICGGYESDAISQYAQSNFTDVLLTEFSDKVTLYNHDLSGSEEIKVIIQGNTSDTQLKSMERTVLCPIGTLKAGMYVLYEESYWLVTGRPDNNKSYEKATLYMCNWLLKWQNKNGEIVSRWAVVESAAKYNAGESGNNTIILGSDQFSINVPSDEESISIDRGMKFFIDYNSSDPTVYQLTNPSNVLYRYGDNNGITHWIVKEVAYSPTAIELEIGVCNYKEPTTTSVDDGDETTILFTISGNDELVIGRNTTYTVSITDENDSNVDDLEYSWNINSEFADEITQTVNGSSITLKCENEDYAYESIVLEILVNNEVRATKTIDIIDVY